MYFLPLLFAFCSAELSSFLVLGDGVWLGLRFQRVLDFPSLGQKENMPATSLGNVAVPPQSRILTAPQGTGTPDDGGSRGRNLRTVTESSLGLKVSHMGGHRETS